MKRIFYKAFGISVLFMLIFAMTSCNDLFTNPLKDKETGEDLTLLLLDPNFFTTTFSVSVIDAQTREEIRLDTKLYVGDENGYDVVDFTGQKGEMIDFSIDEDYKETFYKFHTSSGSLELALDPTLEPSEQSPVNISFKAEVEGYESTTTFETISSTGTKTIYIEMLKKPKAEELVEFTSTTYNLNTAGDSLIFNFGNESGLKAATEIDRPYQINVSVSLFDALAYKDSLGNLLFNSLEDLFIATSLKTEIVIESNLINLTTVRNSVSPIGGGISRINYLHTLYESITLKKVVIGGKKVADFGGSEIEAYVRWNSITIPRPDFCSFWDLNKSKFIFFWEHNMQYGIPLYIAYANRITTCAVGATINFNASTAEKVGFDISMDLMNVNNTKIQTKTFKGLFDESFKFENISNEPVTLKFKNDFFSFKPINDITVSSLCSGVVNVNVEAADGYELYEVTLEAICPDGGGVGVSPSYQGKYKPKGDQNTIWQGITMKAGVFRILCKPNTEYSLKINIDGKDEFIDFSTDDSKYPVGVKTSIGNDTFITNLGKVDGINKVKITHNFTQDICDNLGF